MCGGGCNSAGPGPSSPPPRRPPQPVGRLARERASHEVVAEHVGKPHTYRTIPGTVREVSRQSTFGSGTPLKSQKHHQTAVREWARRKPARRAAVATTCPAARAGKDCVPTITPTAGPNSRARVTEPSAGSRRRKTRRGPGVEVCGADLGSSRAISARLKEPHPRR